MKYHTFRARHLSAALGGVLAAVCAGTALASSGYTTDSRESVVTSGFGECVQTGEWSTEGHTPGCDPAQAAAPPVTELAAVSAPIALVSISDKRNVMFEFDSAQLTPAATSELDQALGKIRGFKDVGGINIVGHTDSIGTETYNQALSERRAESVKQFLESRGMSAELLSSQGQGEASPIADNKTADGRARNRRVDIVVSGMAAE